MNKQLTNKQKRLIALINFDLQCVDVRKIKDKDERYHFTLAVGNLQDLMKELKIKDYTDMD